MRRRNLFNASVAALAAAVAFPTNGFADEGGVSFWVPGLYASLAAVPLQPGWTVNETYYHWQGQAGADVSAAREITIGRFNPTVTLNLSGNLNALADLVFSTAIYTFAEPVLGGQANIELLTVYGRTDTSVNATISGTLGPFPFGPFTRQDFDAVTGFGDLYPQVALRWNEGVNNYINRVKRDGSRSANFQCLLTKNAQRVARIERSEIRGFAPAARRSRVSRRSTRATKSPTP